MILQVLLPETKHQKISTLGKLTRKFEALIFFCIRPLKRTPNDPENIRPNLPRKEILSSNHGLSRAKTACLRGIRNWSVPGSSGILDPFWELRSDLFRGEFSDLHLGDQKVTWKKLVSPVCALKARITPIQPIHNKPTQRNLRDHPKDSMFKEIDIPPSFGCGSSLLVVH